MILKMLMKWGIIWKIDEYLLKNDRKNLKKLIKKPKDLDNFICWYLNQEYDPNTKYNHAIFYYLSAINLDKDKIEELAISSRFLESMPDEEKLAFLNNFDCAKFNILTNMKVLGTYLTSRINDSLDLVSLMDKGVPIDYDYAYRKLSTVGDISKLEEYYNNIKRTMSIRKNLGIMAARSGLYSILEIKEFFLDVNMASDAVVESFVSLYKLADASQKGKIIEEFIAIINDNQNDPRDSFNGNFIVGYDSYLGDIKENRNISIEMKNDMAKKILEDRNYDFIYAWFRNNIMCDYNFNLIDALVLENEAVVKNVLSCINFRYIEYAVSKLLNRDKDFIMRVMNIMCANVYNFDKYRIDSILDMLFNRYYDFKLSHESMMNLIIARSKFLPRFMCDVHFNVDDRQSLLECNWMNEDFRTIYEKYLKTGDRNDLPNEKEARAKFAELEARREKIRGRRKLKCFGNYFIN